MNAKKAKAIRQIIPPTNAIARRMYRRAKKQYNKVPKHAREDFLIGLAHLFAPAENNLDS